MAGFPIDTITLIDLPKAISETSNGTASASYFQLHQAAVNGLIPAHRSATGARWFVKKDDLPKIIETFSLLKEQNSHGKAHKKAKSGRYSKGSGGRHGPRG